MNSTPHCLQPGHCEAKPTKPFLPQEEKRFFPRTPPGRASEKTPLLFLAFLSYRPPNERPMRGVRDAGAQTEGCGRESCPHGSQALTRRVANGRDARHQVSPTGFAHRHRNEHREQPRSARPHFTDGEEERRREGELWGPNKGGMACAGDDWAECARPGKALTPERTLHKAKNDKSEKKD